MKVDVRVTPYQIRDDRRPWIGKEEKKFVAVLTREMSKEKFRRKIYFENEEPCLENHFKILETFRVLCRFVNVFEQCFAKNHALAEFKVGDGIAAHVLHQVGHHNEGLILKLIDCFTRGFGDQHFHDSFDRWESECDC